MRDKKPDRAWFEGKVSELGQAIEKLPSKGRQLELFAELERGAGEERQGNERRKERTD